VLDASLYAAGIPESERKRDAERQDKARAWGRGFENVLSGFAERKKLGN